MSESSLWDIYNSYLYCYFDLFIRAISYIDCSNIFVNQT